MIHCPYRLITGAACVAQSAPLHSKTEMQLRQELRDVIDGTCALADELGVGRTSIWRVAHGYRKSARSGGST